MLALYGKPTSINVRKVLWLCAGLDLPLHHEPAPAPDLLATPSLPMALPADFARQLYQVLVPGTTLLVTSLPAVRPSPAESGMQPVLESEPPGSTLKGN